MAHMLCCAVLLVCCAAQGVQGDVAHVSSTHDAVRQRMAASVHVVKLGLGDAVVDVNGREQEGLRHLTEVEATNKPQQQQLTCKISSACMLGTEIKILLCKAASRCLSQRPKTMYSRTTRHKCPCICCTSASTHAGRQSCWPRSTCRMSCSALHCQVHQQMCVGLG